MSGGNSPPPPLPAGASAHEIAASSIWWIAAGGAVVPIMVTLASWWHARQELDRVIVRVFNLVLGDASLDRLGRYLRGHLGAVSLGTYLSSAEAGARVDRYLAKITELVALPESDDLPIVEQDLGDTDLPELGTALGQANDPPDIAKAIERYQAGGSWDALAFLRRAIEIRMRQIAGVSDGMTGSFMLVGTPSEERSFTRFMRTANRAVHGDTVTDDETLRAIEDARVVFRGLDRGQVSVERRGTRKRPYSV